MWVSVSSGQRHIEFPFDSKSSAPIIPNQPAPPLTEMYVYEVESSNCGVENTVGVSTTGCDHGGSMLRARVLEIGYGSSRIAWMGGGTLPGSALVSSNMVCDDGFGGLVIPCSADQTVVGWFLEYNLDGNQNGFFRYQNTSTNSPFNTMSVQISIL
ncbi:DUF4879 domain-containing protein [Idiomarina sp.]|uniref:DUF4879 domain-containing protein n=1 Tax=Idiomarina sp. TaxID=1874361 RepID=UPI0026303B11|nr:DUF4879 domain-containing protein [Idiomarina sp.]